MAPRTAAVFATPEALRIPGASRIVSFKAQQAHHSHQIQLLVESLDSIQVVGQIWPGRL